jgi:transposase
MKKEVNKENRLRIITAYNNKIKMTDIAKIFECNKSTVHRIVKNYLKEGRVDTKPRGGRMYRKLSGEHINTIKKYIDENCSVTLSSIKRRLNDDFSITVSISTIFRAIKGFSYTLKRLTRIPERRNCDYIIALRRLYCQQLFQILFEHHGKNIVFVDEIGLNPTMRQHRGRALRGKNAVKVVPYIRSRNISICCAMLKNRAFHYRKQNHPFNIEHFSTFLDELFQKFSEEGMKNMLIIMDNVPFYCSEEIKEKILSASHLWIYLPPYSPFLNPIENMFAEWKQMIQSLESQSENELLNTIDSTFYTISDEHCHNYYIHMLNMATRCLNGEIIIDE